MENLLVFDTEAAYIAYIEETDRVVIGGPQGIEIDWFEGD